MAEGVGFEPTVALRLRLISSQVPLTTQPPFQPFTCSYLQIRIDCGVEFLILRFDTGGVNSSPHQSPAGPSQARDWQKTQNANLIRYVPSDADSARRRVSGKLIVQQRKPA